MNTIGARVRAARQKLGYTMKRLHESTGLSTGNISDIENDRNTPSVSSLIPLSRVLGCSIDWLLTGEESETRNSEHKKSCDDIPLSQMENDLIAMLRLLPETAQKEIFDMVHFKYTRVAGGEKESIFWTYFEESSDEESGPAQGHKTQGGTA